MKNKIHTITLIALIAIFLTACGPSTESPKAPPPSQQQEQMTLEKAQQQMNANQPPPVMSYSLERQNIIKRLERFNDPNKVGYLYTLSDDGKIVGFYVVKGKISSVSSYLTTAEQLVCYGDQHGFGDSAYSDYGCLTMEAPDSDGSYGTNGNAIFWFDTNDVYGEWNGKYQYYDQPLQMTQQPLLVQAEN